MATQAELEAAADSLATSPKAMSTDGQSVTEFDLGQIDDHIDRKLNREASSNRRLGVWFCNISQHGATPGACP